MPLLEDKTVQQLTALAESSPQEEICAMLCRDLQTGEITIVPMDNCSKVPEVHYIPEPNQFFAALSKTTRLDPDATLEFMGIFHNHPHHRPIPSEIDVHSCGYPGIYPIYSNLTKELIVYRVEKEGQPWKMLEQYLLSEPVELVAG